MSREIYQEKFRQFYLDNNRMPGYKEMMSLFGFRSKNSVYKLINSWVEEGLLVKDSRGRITPAEGWSGFKILGSVQAGFPTMAEENILDTLNLDNYLVSGDKRNFYLLTVSGDSMIDAGICEGDLVLVEKKEQAKVGSIVVACIDGEWTLKYLRQDKRKRLYLEAANDRYPDMYPQNDLSIGGIVKGVLRRY